MGLVAAEAREALDELHAGVSQAAELMSATATSSRSQAARAASLAEKMSHFSTVSARWLHDADTAAAAMSAQIQAMSDLKQAGLQLADLADRLRESIARFAALRADASVRQGESD